MTTEFSELVAQVSRRALAAGHRIVTAESCTGGWIAKVFTDVPGSSRWYECGFVTYSNAAKIRDLGVLPRTLEEHGAVSEATVREMAAGALRVTGAAVSIAVSGIAGPDGGSAEKPVGTVWFCAGRAARTNAGPPQLLTEGQVFGGDRDAVRQLSVEHALKLLLRLDSRGESKG
jgi:nicotinamide-nucleotide amidase